MVNFRTVSNFLNFHEAPIMVLVGSIGVIIIEPLNEDCFAFAKPKGSFDRVCHGGMTYCRFL